MLFAKAPDRDTRGGGIIADEVNRLADDRASGGIALGVRCGETGELGTDGLADIDGEFRTTDALGLMLDDRTNARHALAPIGQRAGGV